MTELEKAEQEYAAARVAERIAEWKAMEAKAVYYRYASEAMSATAEVMGAALRKKNALASEFVDRAFALEGDAIDDAIAALTPQEAPDTAAVAEPEIPESEPVEFISDLTGNPAIEPETGLHGVPIQRSVEIDGEWIDGDDEEGNKRSVEYSQGFEAGRLGYGYVAGNSEDWLTGFADGKARRDEVDAPEGYAPAVTADEPVTSPAADEAAAGHDYYSPENVAKRTRSVFDIFRREPEEVG